jgi:DNA-directed RNA polymerase II subunit RPB2
VYKDVCNSGGGGGGVEETFENPASSDTCVNLQHGNFEHLGPDGLPSPGTRIGPDDVVIGKTLTRNDSVRGVKADLSTRAKSGGVVDRVLLTQRDGMPAARVVLREMRVPEIGDKASSRHGQKGIIGLLMPQEDMPFIASGPMAGITPDLIVNPHAITSRMTLGHLAESLQSLLGCVTGKPPDATPFQADAEKALERVSDQLHAAGFQRHGNIRMKNGMTGEDIEASVFCGIVYYQRLKHMVRDKIHARTRGPVNFLTRQPLEGRSRDGGQRFGEMERDAGVAHGASEFVADRLLHSTDPFLVPVCKLCGVIAEAAHDPAFGATVTGEKPYCRACDTHEVVTVSLPFASKLVLQELMAVGISVSLKTE